MKRLGMNDSDIMEGMGWKSITTLRRVYSGPWLGSWPKRPMGGIVLGMLSASVGWDITAGGELAVKGRKDILVYPGVFDDGRDP